MLPTLGMLDPTWWVGPNEEWFTSECATLEEAVAEAQSSEDGAWVVQATRWNVALSGIAFSGESIDMLLDLGFDDDNEDFCETFGDDTGNHQVAIPVITPEQKAQLLKRLKRTMDLWQMENKIFLPSTVFARTANQEWIDAKTD
jgi:hypothetical protein